MTFTNVKEFEVKLLQKASSHPPVPVAVKQRKPAKPLSSESSFSFDNPFQRFS